MKFEFQIRNKVLFIFSDNIINHTLLILKTHFQCICNFDGTVCGSCIIRELHWMRQCRLKIPVLEWLSPFTTIAAGHSSALLKHINNFDPGQSNRLLLERNTHHSSEGDVVGLKENSERSKELSPG